MLFEDIVDIFVQVYIIYDCRLFYLFLKLNKQLKLYTETNFKKIMIKYCFADLASFLPLSNNLFISDNDLKKVFDKTVFDIDEIIIINSQIINKTYKKDFISNGNLFLTRKDGLIIKLPSSELYKEIIFTEYNNNSNNLFLTVYCRNMEIKKISYEIDDVYLQILEDLTMQLLNGKTPLF